MLASGPFRGEVEWSVVNGTGAYEGLMAGAPPSPISIPSE